MDVRTIALVLSLSVVGSSLLAMMVSVMRHHVVDKSQVRQAAVDFLWTLVPCCMMLVLMGSSLKAAWANTFLG